MSGSGRRPAIAVLYGGRSSEHEISCVTADAVMAAIDRERFDVHPVGITREGAHTLQPDEPGLLRLRPEAMPVVPDNGTRICWPHGVADRVLRVLGPDGRSRELGPVDVVFPVLHGRFGEDGTVQGQLELIDIPYVGSGVLASALAMDKHYAKSVLSSAGIAVAPWTRITRSGWAADPEGALRAAGELGEDVFVKPSRAGSSMGVSRVRAGAGLREAVQEAFAHDSSVIVERAIAGREIELAVLGGRDGAAPRVSPPGEIVVSGRDFYDYAAKYLGAEGVRTLAPTSVEPAELDALTSTAARAFEALGCADLARVDFFLTPEGPVVNEVNTMPGFTPISLYPTLWQAAGLSYERLVAELIELALARGGSR